MKDLFERINNIIVTGLSKEDEYYIQDEIESARECEQKYAYYHINQLEVVAIDVDTYEVTNESEYTKDDIEKAYAISEFTGYSLYDIMNKSGGQWEGQKIIDRYAFYGDVSEEELIAKLLEGNCWDDNDYTEEEKINSIKSSIGDGIYNTLWGYLEEYV